MTFEEIKGAFVAQRTRTMEQLNKSKAALKLAESQAANARHEVQRLEAELESADKLLSAAQVIEAGLA